MNRDDFVEVEVYPHDARNRSCYRIHAGWSGETLETTAQGLLNLAAWIEANRVRLEQEAQVDQGTKSQNYPTSHPHRIIHDGGATHEH